MEDENDSREHKASQPDTDSFIQELLSKDLSVPDGLHPVLYSRALVAAAQGCTASIQSLLDFFRNCNSSLLRLVYITGSRLF
jgi:hypothetical protein